MTLTKFLVVFSLLWTCVHLFGLRSLWSHSARQIGKSKMRILLMVMSHGSRRQDIQRRAEMRRVWKKWHLRSHTLGLDCEFQFRFFACATASMSSKDAFEGDMVWLSCDEDYKALSTKVLRMFSWVQRAREEKKLHFDFVAKTDSDVFVDLVALSNEMARIQPLRSDPFWWGFVYRNMLTNRDVTDKNSDATYPLPGYPPYTAGVLYLFDTIVLSRLVRAYESGRTMVLRNEDQTVGVTLARLGVRPVHTVYLQQWKVCANDLIAIHPVSRADYRKLSDNMMSARPSPKCEHISPRTLCPLCYDRRRCEKDFPLGFKWWEMWECDKTLGAAIKEESLGSLGVSRHFERVLRTLDQSRRDALNQSERARKIREKCSHYDACNLQIILDSKTGTCSQDSLVSQADRVFFLVWTTSSASFTLRHHRTIESILYHHPEARVRVVSNSLTCTMFSWLRDDGFDVKVMRYNVTKLAESLPGSQWLAQVSRWQRGKNFYAHYADFIRLLVLHRYGGVYMDTDVILLNRIPRSVKNAVAVERCDEPRTHTFCFRLPEFGSGWETSQRDVFYVPNSMMVFERGHPALTLSLHEFDRDYDPQFWPCGTVYLSRAVAQLRRSNQLSPYEILHKGAFYPVSWQVAQSLFKEPFNERAFNASIATQSIAMHLWNKMFASYAPKPPDFLHVILERFALYKL